MLTSEYEIVYNWRTARDRRDKSIDHKRETRVDILTGAVLIFADHTSGLHCLLAAKCVVILPTDEVYSDLRYSLLAE
jgi:hypothetical protein